MHPSLLKLASDLAQRGEPFAMVTVVRREPPSSARVGDGALVTRGGSFHGWLGGSCTQPTAVNEALAALGDGRPRLLALRGDPESEARPGVTILPMTCHSGGSVDLYIEPVLPSPRLLVFGVSPTAQALVRLAAVLGYAVEAIDVAAEQAIFPEADRVVTDIRAPDLQERAKRDPDRLFALVAGLGDQDIDAVEAALDLKPAYLGIVASRKRFAELRGSLVARGVDAGRLDGIDNPAGLDLGAVTPAEIALSILAEMVRHDRSRSPARSGSPEPRSPAGERDPVCGMTVAKEGALFHAEVNGQTYYFCCGGCRDRFVADPSQFSAVPGGRERA